MAKKHNLNGPEVELFCESVNKLFEQTYSNAGKQKTSKKPDGTSVIEFSEATTVPISFDITRYV